MSNRKQQLYRAEVKKDGDIVWAYGQLVQNTYTDNDGDEIVRSYILPKYDILDGFENHDFKISFKESLEVVNKKSICRKVGEKEMYERDIVEFVLDKKKSIGVIMYCEERCMFCIAQDEKSEEKSQRVLMSEVDDIKVIGDMVDHKDEFKNNELSKRWVVSIPKETTFGGTSEKYIEKLELAYRIEDGKLFHTKKEAEECAKNFNDAKVVETSVQPLDYWEQR